MILTSVGHEKMEEDEDLFIHGMQLYPAANFCRINAEPKLVPMLYSSYVMVGSVYFFYG